MPSLIERQVLRARNGLAYLAGTNRPLIAQTPKDTVWRRDKAQLWRYRPEDDTPRVTPPILIVHSLVSKSYVLDLMPNNSMIRYLLGEGFDVFLLDWGVADPAEAANTLRTTSRTTSPRRSRRRCASRAPTRSTSSATASAASSRCCSRPATRSCRSAAS